MSLKVSPGQTLGIVGESGCGKSTLGRCLLRLADSSSGQVLFEGQDITAQSERALRRLRPRMQMVFQDSYASLNPRRRVADLLAEPMRVHPQPDGAPHDRAFVNRRLRDLLELTGCRQAHWTAIRTSSPAGSGNASTLPARWHCSPA